MHTPRSSRRTRRRAGIGLALSAVLASSLATVALTPAPTQAAPVAGTSLTTWTYLENDTFPSAGDSDALSWTKPEFDDTAWKTGKSGFGGKVSGSNQSGVYDGTRTATTQLEMNAPGSSNRVRTYFFRADVELTEAQLADVAVARGTMHVDDGAVVYVNGTEVGRGDVPAGSEGLSYAPGGSTGLDTIEFSVARDLLRAGTNTIAVEVHNDRASSSDIWFDLLSLDTLTAEEAATRPTRVILTPTDAPGTSQNVTFQGADAEDTTGRVEIRPTAGGDTKFVKAPLQPGAVSNPFPHFSATVTGLQPGTGYSYRVSSNGKWSTWHEFETADPTEGEFSYLYYGDAQIGLDTTWPKVVDAAMAKAPDAIGSVHAGDLIDTSSNDTQWQNWFKGMATAGATTNVMAAPGNHEYSGDKLMTSWKAHFEYPLNNPNLSTIGEMAKLAEGTSDEAKQYRAYFEHWSEFAAETVYFTDYQGVRFITVNATRDTTFLTPDALPSCSGAECPSTKVAELWTEFQANWLDHVLSKSTSKWNVVTFHQPVYSTSTGRNEAVLRKHWVPVFEKHDIDLVQMGHDHTYARGFKNDTATDTPGVTAGPVYIVANSGAKHYDLETDAKNVWTLNGATQVQKAADITTYQVVDVKPDRLVYRSYIAEIAGTGLFYKNGQQVDSADYKVGDLWDTFTVHKTDQGQKAVVEAGVTPPAFEDLSEPPTLVTDLPASTVVVPGERVSLKVEAAAPAGTTATVVWQQQKVGGTWTDLAGETGNRLSLGVVGAADLGTRYRAVVSAGTRSVTSTVTELVEAGQAPVFRTDLPATVTVAAGGSTTLRAEAVALAPVGYQWQRQQNGTWTDLPGRTGPVLELSQVRGAATSYRVLATAGTRSTPSAASTVTPVATQGTVTITSTKLKQGKAAVVKVRSDVDGVVQVRVVRGKKVVTGTVLVTAGTTATVRTDKLKPARSAKAQRKAKKQKARVQVTLTPLSSDVAPARAEVTTRVR